MITIRTYVGYNKHTIIPSTTSLLIQFMYVCQRIVCGILEAKAVTILFFMQN